MSNRKLIHFQFDDTGRQYLIPVYICYLRKNQSWFNNNYETICDEIGKLLTANKDDIEKRARSDGKHIFRKLSGGDILNVAYSARMVPSFSVLKLSKEVNESFYVTDYTLYLWTSPVGGCIPVECVC